MGIFVWKLQIKNLTFSLSRFYFQVPYERPVQKMFLTHALPVQSEREQMEIKCNLWAFWDGDVEENT